MVNLTKQTDISGINEKTNQKQRELIESVEGIRIKILLNERLKESNMTQKELSEKTGIGANMISAFCNNREGVKIGYAHIMSIMIALELSKIEQLLEVEMPEEVKGKFNVAYNKRMANQEK